jgi:hypothetical protein
MFLAQRYERQAIGGAAEAGTGTADGAVMATATGGDRGESDRQQTCSVEVLVNSRR